MKYQDFSFDLSVHFEQLEISLNIMRKFCITSSSTGQAALHIHEELNNSYTVSP